GISYPSTIVGEQLAIEMLNKSIHLDSSYAPAYAELGFRRQRFGVSILDRETINQAEQAYLKALSLNKELFTALGYLAMLYTETARTEQAMELATQMLKINPNNAFGYFSLGYVYRYAGMLKESEHEFEKALALEPKNPKLRTVGLTYLYLGKYKKAMAACDLDPESNWSIAIRGEIYLRQNQTEKAMEYFDRFLALEPEGHGGKVKGRKAFVEGNHQEGLRVTRQWEQQRPCDSEDWYFLATHYGLFSDKAGCARALQKAIEGGFFNYPFMLKDPFLDSVRGDPEFQRVLTMAKTKHEAFQKRFFP
ncbi:MAG: tetratricopeptide repeat protein, partial [Desulfatiglandales bacterium]